MSEHSSTTAAPFSDMNSDRPAFKWLSMALSLLLIGQMAVAQDAHHTVHVSRQGNDSNPGTRDAPMATLDAAISRVAVMRKMQQRTDTMFILVAPGDYPITEPIRIGPDRSGTDGSPLVIAGSGMDRTVIRGGIPLPRFEKVSASLWRTPLPKTGPAAMPEQLYVNGERRFLAQAPDRNAFFTLKDAKETPLAGSPAEGANSFADLRVYLRDADKKWLSAIKPEEQDRVMASFYHKWNVTRLPVNRYDPATASFTCLQQGLQPWNKIDGETRMYLSNFRAALDAPGEWIAEKDGFLYYIPMPGESIDKTTAIVPVTEKFLQIEGGSGPGQQVRQVIIRNMGFRFTGYRTPSSGQRAAQAAHPTDATITLNYAADVTIEDCEIAHTGTYGVWFNRGCTNDRMLRCHLHDLGAGGVKIGDPQASQLNARTTSSITVDDNIIQHGGHVFPEAAGVIIFHSMDDQVTHNDIADFRYTGISVGWIWGYANSLSKRNTIAFNHIHHLGWGELSDMGGVYTLGPSEGTTVNNNTIHHIYSRYYGGWGLYTDEGSTGIILENNLVYQCKSGGFHQHYGKENIIRNNIFALQWRSQLEATREEPHRSFTFTNNIVYFSTGDLAGINWNKVRFSADSNCYWNTRSTSLNVQGIPFESWRSRGMDVHSIIADPQFMNPAASDFRLRNNAVADKIGFKPFALDRSGVYGSPEWRKRAEISPEMSSAFDNTVSAAEKEKAPGKK